MRIVSVILMSIMLLGFASCKAYNPTTCEVYEVASCEDYTEVTVEKDGNLYTAALGHFDEEKKECFVVFYNGEDTPEDDKIVFIW